jgi:hypothetical protein
VVNEKGQSFAIGENLVNRVGAMPIRVDKNSSAIKLQGIALNDSLETLKLSSVSNRIDNPPYAFIGVHS